MGYEVGSKIVVANQEELDIMNKHGKYTLGKVYEVHVDYGGTIKVKDDNDLVFTWNNERWKEYNGEEEINKGYQLADGSWSSEYNIGDKFVVTKVCSVFTTGSVISFYSDDNSDKPCFKLVNGRSFYQNCDGEDGGYISWIKLTPYKEEKDMSKFDIKEFKIGDLKTGMKVTVSRPYISGHAEYIALLDTPAGSFLVNTEVNSYSSLKDISIYGQIIKVEKSEVPFNLKIDGNLKWTTVWEKPVPLTQEQIRQRELREQYEVTKKQLEELGKQIGVVE